MRTLKFAHVTVRRGGAHRPEADWQDEVHSWQLEAEDEKEEEPYYDHDIVDVGMAVDDEGQDQNKNTKISRGERRSKG